MQSKLFAALLSASLLVAGTALVRAAEQSGHEGHHPAASDDNKSQDAEHREAGNKTMKQGGMMDGKNCKMMENMHANMSGSARPKGDASPSSLAFNGIAMKMHEDMSLAYTGNADVDFVNGMIPHHQAAVDMAKTVLAFGKDAEVKKLAEDVVKTQEAEIAQLKAWLEKNGAK